MNKKIYATALAAGLILAGCSDDLTPNAPAVDADGRQNVQFTLGIPNTDIANTRAFHKETNTSSAMGGVTNLDMTKYDVRYQVAIYEDVNGQWERVVDNQVKTLDTYAAVTYDFRLVPTRHYKLVAWADFVEQGSTADLYYNTADMAEITVKDNADLDLNNEARDAYFKSYEFTLDGSDLTGRITLRRPFAKLRLVTKDWNYGNLEMPDNFRIIYKNCKRFTGINALSGKDIDGEKAANNGEVDRSVAGTTVDVSNGPDVNTPTQGNTVGDSNDVADLGDQTVTCRGAIDKMKKEYTGIVEVPVNDERWDGQPLGDNSGDSPDGTIQGGQERVIADYDNYANGRTLVVDYLWTDEYDQTPIQFNYAAFDGDKKLYDHDFNADIPIKRNYITTIFGNLITVGGKFDVRIDPYFVNEWVYAEPWWAPYEVTPVDPAANGHYDAATKTYHVYNSAEFAWFQGKTLPGYKVVLEADIDMNNINWQPIGSTALGRTFDFDGQGHVLRNFKIEGNYIGTSTFNSEPVECIGVFGNFEGTMENVVFENITINGLFAAHTYDSDGNQTGIHEEYAYFAGPVAYFKGTMRNVHARHVFIRGMNESNVGGLIGYTNPGSETNLISGCSAQDIHLAGDQAGGLVGSLHRNSTVENSATEHIYIYLPVEAGGFVGDVVDGTDVTFSGNTVPTVVEYYDFLGHPLGYTEDADGQGLWGSCRKNKASITIN